MSASPLRCSATVNQGKGAACARARRHLHFSEFVESVVPGAVCGDKLLLHVARALQRLRPQRQVVVDVGLQRHLRLAQPLRQLRHVRV
jgi:hypothetical protein